MHPYMEAREGMNAKHGYAGAVLLVLLAAPLTRAQAPQTLPYLKEQPVATPPMDVPPSGLPSGFTPANQAAAQPNPADAYPLPWEPSPLSVGCCGPTGGCGPIGPEIYVRSGPSFLVSNTLFAKSFDTGWETTGGGRSLFFNKACDGAWIVDLSVTYDYNDGHPTNSLNFQGTPVTMRNLDRTAVGLGFGHDWWVFGPGNVGACDGCNLRYGFDAGTRWGTQHVDMNIVGIEGGYLRSHDLFGAAYVGLHFDLEVPMGGWTFFTGIRGGGTYTFGGDVVGANINSSLHEVNALWTIGVRY